MNPRLDSFLRKHASNSDLASIVVRHVTPTGKFGKGIIYKHEDFELTPEWLKRTAETIENACEADAEGLGSTQTYGILAYHKGEKEPAGRMTLRISEESDDDAASTEPATGAGIIAQNMRHTEAMAKIMVAQCESMALQSARTIDTLSKQLVSMQEKHHTLIENVEEMMTLKHERALELKEAEGRGEAIKQLGTGLKTVLPAIIEKMTGKDLLTPKLLAFAERMTPEQFEKWAADMPPDQQAIFVDILSTLQQNKGA